jgi:hypothetical protein
MLRPRKNGCKSSRDNAAMQAARAVRLIGTRALGWRCCALGVLVSALAVAAHAGAQSAEPPAESTRPASVAPGPGSLSVTVITSAASVPTLRERVSSWFNDGTQVSVDVASELSPERIFTVGAREVKVWVVLPSAERALVIFSAAPGEQTARYLLRDVRLLNGLDELGLERLASVIHSAFVALREGIEGSERPQVEKELIDAGLLPSATSQDRSQPAPAVPTSAGPTETSPAAPPHDATARGPGAAILLAAGYGLRLRGAEGLGHGPLLSAGMQLPGSGGALDALISAHVMFRSGFDAGGLAASVRTSAFRAHVGFEPSLSSRVKLQALLGAGADLAQISARVAAGSSGEQLKPRDAGSQWRAALELSLDLWWQLGRVELGAGAGASLLLGDVHYSLRADGIEQRLVAPWPVQPSLSLQARFRNGS